MHLVTLYGFLVYENKFTVGKSKVMVFTACNRRDRWGGGISLQEMSNKTLGGIFLMIISYAVNAGSPGERIRKIGHYLAKL